LPKFGEIFQASETNIEEQTQHYQSEMKALNKEKKRIIIYCEQVLRDSEREAEKETITLIEAFKKLWKH